MKIAPRITDPTSAFLVATWGNNNAGAEYVLDSAPLLYQRTLQELRGWFTEDELSLILLAFKETKEFAPSLAGNYLSVLVVNHGSDDINQINGKIAGLNLYDRACLEVWARAFWLQHQRNGKKSVSFGEWIAQLK